VSRGDVVVAVFPGSDYGGKPRPFVVLQADQFGEHPSLTLALITSELHTAPLFRLTVDPSPGNGLRVVSQICVDKILTVPRDKVGKVIGQMDADVMVRVNRALAGWLGIA
jgi:mRNA interferase MazF